MGNTEAPSEAWVRDPRAAARAWLSAPEGPGYAAQSIAQYTAMIGSAADWLDEHAGQTLLSAQSRDVDRFIGSLVGRGGKPASVSTVKRYLATLTMVFDHLRQSGLRQSHPMDALKHAAARAGGDRQAPRFLHPEQAEVYQAWVLSQARQHWCDERDAALRTIYLASGITVEESLALSVRDLRLGDSPACVRVRSRIATQDRRVPLPAWSLPVLRQWLATRLQLPILGDVAFPARKRSPTVDVDGGEPLGMSISASEVYDLIRPAMEAAGLDGEQLGPQTLRNSYAVRQLAAQVPPEQIQKWMGLRTGFTLEAIKRELAQDQGPAPA